MLVLIDTWWNVNEEIKSEVKIDDTSFNRYMVECELMKQKYFLHFSGSFNRYMVECELDYDGLVLRVEQVLIDTWWNVNHPMKWVFTTGYTGFNRYMVECEYIFRNDIIPNLICFNRYMVECEFAI